MRQLSGGPICHTSLVEWKRNGLVPKVETVSCENFHVFHLLVFAITTIATQFIVCVSAIPSSATNCHSNCSENLIVNAHSGTFGFAAVAKSVANSCRQQQRPDQKSGDISAPSFSGQTSKAWDAFSVLFLSIGLDIALFTRQRSFVHNDAAHVEQRLLGQKARACGLFVSLNAPLP